MALENAQMYGLDEDDDYGNESVYGTWEIYSSELHDDYL